MKPDHIRKLLGGYATDSLSEAERTLLFEAALEDQDLFDELAREQALKEMLQTPGAKQRLLEALQAEPRPVPWWQRPWPRFAAIAAMAVIVLGIVILRRPVPTQEVAEVRIPEPRVEAPVAIAPEPVAPEAAAPTAPPAPKISRGTTVATGSLEAPRNAPDKTADNSVEAVSPQQKEADSARALSVPLVAPRSKSEPAERTMARADAAQAPAAPATAAAPPPAAVGGVVGGFGGGFGGGGGGGRGGRGGAAVVPRFAPAPLAAAAKAAPAGAPFSLDYSITPESGLRIVPATQGFLSVTTSDGGNSQFPLLDRQTTAGVAVQIPIPPGSTSITIVFARNQGSGAVDGTGAVTDATSGSLTDPNPSPASRLQTVIRLTPPR